jgi:hypothetical protein
MMRAVSIVEMGRVLSEGSQNIPQYLKLYMKLLKWYIISGNTNIIQYIFISYSEFVCVVCCFEVGTLGHLPRKNDTFPERVVL